MTNTEEEQDPPENEDEYEDAPPEATAPPAPSMWAWLRDCYFSIDRRTLGFARFMVGFFLLTDLGRRTGTWMDMYSSVGVLPSDLNLRSPTMGPTFSIFHAFLTPFELGVLWTLMFVTFLCLFIGYKTKLAQILALIFVTGMNVRVGQIANGGYTTENLLVLWTCFLPMGDRFSVDAMIASMKRRREASAEELNDREGLLPKEKQGPHVSLIALVLLLQIAAIYFFNARHKTGPAWQNGTAVHYVLYVDRMVNPIIGITRDYIPNPVIIFLTKSTLIFEIVISVAVLSPLARAWGRRIAIVLMNFLHIGFGVAMVLGPFSWACCCFSTLLFTEDDWSIAARTMRREHRARVVLFDPEMAGAVFVCRVLARLDQFELLVFQEASDLPLGIAVLGEDDARIERAAAFAEIIAALPLGPCVAWLLRVPGLSGAFDALLRWIERRDVAAYLGLRIRRGSAVEPPSPVRRRLGHVAIGLRELAILAMLAAEVNQALVQLWVFAKLKAPQPEPLATLAHKMRFDQEWYMFSPNPVMDDGTIVVDALTVDGRHIDPFTMEKPSFSIANVKSFGYNQIWSDYLNRMHMGNYAGYREAMKAYLYRLPERTGNPNDALVSGDVYWAQDMNPKWNTIESYDAQQIKLFSFENPAFRGRAAPR